MRQAVLFVIGLSFVASHGLACKQACSNGYSESDWAYCVADVLVSAMVTDKVGPLTRWTPSGLTDYYRYTLDIKHVIRRSYDIDVPSLLLLGAGECGTELQNGTSYILGGDLSGFWFGEEEHIDSDYCYNAILEISSANEVPLRVQNLDCSELDNMFSKKRRALTEMRGKQIAPLD